MEEEEEEEEEKREREIFYGRYSKLACSPFVIVTVNGFGHFLEQPELCTLTAFECLKSCGGRIPF